MKNILLISIFAILHLSISCFGTNYVNVKFKIENRQKNLNQIRLMPVANGKEYMLKISHGHFKVPNPIDSNGIEIILYYRGAKIDFGKINPSKFLTKWVIGIDKRPFNQDVDNVADKSYNCLYYIKFIPQRGDGTTAIAYRK